VKDTLLGYALLGLLMLWFLTPVVLLWVALVWYLS